MLRSIGDEELERRRCDGDATARDDNVKGHTFGSFLALYLVVELRKKLEAAGSKVEWSDLVRDLEQMRALELNPEQQRHLLRTELRGYANAAFQAVNLRPPPLAQSLAGATDV